MTKNTLDLQRQVKQNILISFTVIFYHLRHNNQPYPDDKRFMCNGALHSGPREAFLDCPARQGPTFPAGRTAPCCGLR